MALQHSIFYPRSLTDGIGAPASGTAFVTEPMADRISRECSIRARLSNRMKGPESLFFECIQGRFHGKVSNTQTHHRYDSIPAIRKPDQPT
jgi:hypothetical protein